MNKLAFATQLEAAVQRHRRGEHAEAEQLYERLLVAEPRHVELLHYAGLLALQTGRFDLAAERLRASVKAGNDSAGTHLLLGRAHKSSGRLEAAISSYRRAIALDGKLVDAYVSLGIAYRANGQAEDATRAYRRALALDPRSFEAHLNLGNVLQAAGKVSEALEQYAQAERLKPSSAQLNLQLGKALRLVKRNSEAADRFERAISSDPRTLDAYFWFGGTLNLLKQYEAAATCFQSLLAKLAEGTGRFEDPALNQQPRLEARAALTDALYCCGRCDEALAIVEEDLRETPDSVTLLSNLLLVAPYRITSQRRIVEIYRHYQAVSQSGPTPNLATLPTSVPARLRIGYLSGDFRGHSVAFFIEPLLACHDRSAFEVFCYSSNEEDDEMTARLRSHADTWVDARLLSDFDLAQRIAADRIDVLVDLSGRTKDNRARTLQQHPGGLQLSYLGYPTYTGLRAIEYRVTDAVIDPEGSESEEALAAEKPLRLPGGMFCYRPAADAPDVSLRQAEGGGAVRFGSFNQVHKIGPGITAAWVEILHRVPTAILVLKAFAFIDDASRRRVLESFVTAGVAADRVDLRRPAKDRSEHLGQYGEIDIALDTFPYNGATTTCEALWMGVPVVTLTGETHASRMGASLLGAVGLDEFVATTVDEYIDTAVALAADAAGRAELRRTLRDRVSASTLRDERGFTLCFEKAVRSAWQARWAKLRGGQTDEAAQD